LQTDIVKHCLECFQISMNVTDNGTFGHVVIQLKSTLLRQSF
jgi:hypothetical protein